MWRILKGEPPKDSVYMDWVQLPEVETLEEMYTAEVERVAALRGREVPYQYQEALISSSGHKYVGVHVMFENGDEQSIWYHWDDGTGIGPKPSATDGVAGKFIVAGLSIVALGLGAIWLSKK